MTEEVTNNSWNSKDETLLFDGLCLEKREASFFLQDFEQSGWSLDLHLLEVLTDRFPESEFTGGL